MSTRRHAPAALRNRGPIADVLARVLPPSGLVLEIASGTGDHVEHFAERFPALRFQPTDPDASARTNVEALRRARPELAIAAPLELDVVASWPIERADAIVCINMLHASPRESSPALFRGAARVLAVGCALVTYGPYRIGGVHTAPSNEEFDRWLKSERDPRWGVRDLEWLDELASEAGFAREELVPMPANNYTVVWRRR